MLGIVFRRLSAVDAKEIAADQRLAETLQIPRSRELMPSAATYRRG
jgi:hypothetical protein